LPLPPANPEVPDALAPERAAGRANLAQLVLLRWLAVGGQLLTILTVHFGLGIRLPLKPLLAFLAALLLFNLASWVRSRQAQQVGDAELLAGLMVDVLVLTGLLALTGGTGNPFAFFYLPPLVVGALLLRPPAAWALAATSFVALLMLAQWHVPLAWPDAAAPQNSVHYVGGLLLCFALCAALVVFVVSRTQATLRLRDARLAALRQRAAEEDHIVRMGLLASGAAHELGTPLATLAVILGDWARMAPFAAEPELREEIEQMQTQVQRCKNIIRGILLSAGDSHGEQPSLTTLNAFFHEHAAHWQASRGAGVLALDLDDLPALPMVSDSALKQMLDNVLDNALEAAKQPPLLRARCEDEDHLLIEVQDSGPGFTPETLAGLGRPYNSSKGRPGSGLGLFLAVNVARKLGGTLTAGNLGPAGRPGGALVRIRLPLDSLLADTDNRMDNGEPIA
jgi:two-component system sensor histidine kinase RegB